MSPKLLREFKHALVERDEKMSPVIEGMIREWMHRREIVIPRDSEDVVEPAGSQSRPKSAGGSLSGTTSVVVAHNSQFGGAQAEVSSSVSDRNDDATVVGALALAKAAQRAALNPWNQILASLERKINRQSFETWLKPTRYSHAAGRTLYVLVPSPEFCHVGDRYGDLIDEAIDRQSMEFDEVCFVTADENPSAPPLGQDDINLGRISAQTPTASSAPASRLHEHARFDWSNAAQLNSRYTFDNFVIGNGNQFAHAAALAVVEHPSPVYSPLFMYGGVGLGKTHLMQAIGHEMKRRQPTSNICYVSAEEFSNEMIASIRDDRIRTFRNRMRAVDVLLIDDIQFIAQKERLQEELFHTFNALHESTKKIVIASDRPPRQLSGIEDRLRSRFEWGLVADIQRPDLETKIAILQKKAEIEQVVLPADVALYIASNVRTNVRELEGGLVRLIAWCQLNHVDITLGATRQCLEQFIQMQVRKVTVEMIQRAVIELFGMRLRDLKEKNNSRSVVVPRQIAMYLAKQMTEASLAEIGRQFGNKSSSTVMHSIAKIDDQRRTDTDLHRTLNRLQERLNG